MPSLSKAASEKATQLLDDATLNPSHDVPGAVFVAINREGKPIFSHASGPRSLADPNMPMTVDSTFWFASLSKAITGIAAMQLYEQGKLDLDSTSQLEEVFPEGARAKLITGSAEDGKPLFEEKKNKMTTRMLLTHTSGYSYDFFSEKINQKMKYNEKQPGWVRPPHPLDEPVIFEPGTDFGYGIGIDCVGVIVERISGLKLDDYFQKFIFEPAGIKNVSFLLNDEMQNSLAGLHMRLPTGEIISIPHVIKPEASDEYFQGGGGKIFGQPKSYADILAILLNNGVSPKTGNRILKSETVDYMFENHLGPAITPEMMKPKTSQIAHVVNTTLKSWSSAPEPHWWGLTFLVTGSDVEGGRAKGTAEWAGLANCYWWCDRVKGIAGVYCSQLLPFKDDKIVPLFNDLEKAIYSGLE